MTYTTTYHRHIDGLRAISVLSVIFYHFGQPLFSGGYVGVDIFFVISGFLITKLILSELENTGTFNFKRFYIRRMRRLIPALLATLVGSLLCAAILYSPEQLSAFGKSLSSAILSVSNILFWTESGYFDADSHLKPLLHTWSLSVEEQFYLFWPAILVFFIGAQRNHSKIIYTLLFIGFFSFILNAIWVNGNFDSDYKSTIFYLTPFRIFELTLGALAIFIASRLPSGTCQPGVAIF